tara:strand:- start:531 stop:836 length:306 start_codon:yes stop_codon:yes gene_type:complete
MKQAIQTNSCYQEQIQKPYANYEEQLQAFKKRLNLQEVNTSKEAAFALRVSDFTMRLSRSTGKLLGVKAPRHVNYGRTVRYKAADLMAWLEQSESQEKDAA